MPKQDSIHHKIHAYGKRQERQIEDSLSIGMFCERWVSFASVAEEKVRKSKALGAFGSESLCRGASVV